MACITKYFSRVGMCGRTRSHTFQVEGVKPEARKQLMRGGWNQRQHGLPGECQRVYFRCLLLSHAGIFTRVPQYLSFSHVQSSEFRSNRWCNALPRLKRPLDLIFTALMEVLSCYRWSRQSVVLTDNACTVNHRRPSQTMAPRMVLGPSMAPQVVLSRRRWSAP